MNKEQRMITVAEDEVMQEMIRGTPCRLPRLSHLIAKILAHPTFAGKSERDVFFDAYGRSREGLRVYLTPKKSEECCVREFCVARLKNFELEHTQNNEAEKIQNYLTKTPAT